MADFIQESIQPLTTLFTILLLLFITPPMVSVTAFLWQQKFITRNTLEDTAVEAMKRAMMRNQIHSTLNMESIMTNTTQTSVNRELVMSMATLLVNTRWLFLMAESNMSLIRLMPTMLVRPWKFHTKERPDTQSPIL